MQPAELPTETLDNDSQDVWENGCIPTPALWFGCVSTQRD